MSQQARVVKDMSITHAEFFRTLRRLLAARQHELQPDGASVVLGDGRVEIHLGPQGTRELGNVRLPRTFVELQFTGCTPDAVDAFVGDFDRCFRRGGG